MTRDERLERWLEALLATPGLTGIRDRERAWRELVDDALRAVAVVQRFEGPDGIVAPGEYLIGAGTK